MSLLYMALKDGFVSLEIRSASLFNPKVYVKSVFWSKMKMNPKKDNFDKRELIFAGTSKYNETSST